MVGRKANQGVSCRRESSRFAPEEIGKGNLRRNDVSDVFSVLTKAEFQNEPETVDERGLALSTALYLGGGYLGAQPSFASGSTWQIRTAFSRRHGNEQGSVCRVPRGAAISSNRRQLLRRNKFTSSFASNTGGFRQSALFPSWSP